MKSLKLIMLAALVLTLAGLGQATTIALVSDADAPDVGGIDDSYVSFLEGLGYTVDTTGMGGNFNEDAGSPWAAGNEAKLAVLQNADLIIISRKTNSGKYDDDRMAWNSLSTPLLLHSGYLTRGELSSKKWGWSTGASGDADMVATDLEIIGAHPFLPVPQVFDWSANGGEAPKGVYLPVSSDDIAAGGTVIAEFADMPFLIDFAAGTDLDAANGTADKYGVLGARRAFLGHWGYDEGENEVPPAYGWDDFITDDYKDILAGTIAQMIPEPATMVLLGLGGLMLRRRR